MSKLALLAASMALLAAAPPPRRDDVFELMAARDPFEGIPFNPFAGGYHEPRGPVIVGGGHKRTHVAVPNPKAERRKAMRVAEMQERKAARKRPKPEQKP